MRKWGFWGVSKREFWATISVLTILFDIWGVTIQFTAAMGFVVPAISLLILLAKRLKFLPFIVLFKLVTSALSLLSVEVGFSRFSGKVEPLCL
jgi:hypothetical protein